MSVPRPRRRRLAAVVAAPLLAALPAATALPVAGGERADPAQWPFMVSLLDPATADPFQAQYCGGALIRTDWVLTAAHCVTRDDGTPMAPGEVQVATGADLTAITPEARIPVDRVYVYPRYRPNVGGDRRFAYDVAVLHLTRPAGPPPVALPQAQLPERYRPSRASVAGWGRATAEAFPTLLRTGGVSVSLPAQCREITGVHGVVCATLPGSQEASICDGDSGGPLVDFSAAVPQVIGVVNFGRAGVCERGSIGAFADVGLFRTWIAYVSRGEARAGVSLPEVSSVRARDVGDTIDVRTVWCQDGARGHRVRLDAFVFRGQRIVRSVTTRARAAFRCLEGEQGIADTLPAGRYTVVAKVTDTTTGMSFRSAPVPLAVR